MCYPKPGPRCSRHAAERLARIQAQVNNALHHMDWEDERLKKMVDERNLAREEFNITPAGLAILKRRADGGQGYLEAEYNKYAALREERLKAMRESHPGSVESSHEDASSKLKEAYAALGITYDFDTTNTPRVGWDEDKDKYLKTAEMLSHASAVWLDKMSEEHVDAIAWLTENGTRILSQKSYGTLDEVPESMLGNVDIEKMEGLINEALDRAPRMKEKFVTYRGIGGEVPFDVDSLHEGSTYETPSPVSTTLNPGVANSFGYKNIILEMKTNRMSTPQTFSSAGPREAEILLPQGAKFRVSKILKDVSFGWSEDKLVEGYTVVQMEEIEA